MNRIAEPDCTQLRFSRLYPRVLLASTSPNRKALLEKGGTAVDTFSPCTEERREGESLDEIVIGIARQKLDACLASIVPSVPAIAADTLVLKDGVLLGKPGSIEEAKEMLRRLSGSRHTVLTACSAAYPGAGRHDFIDKADVVFRNLSDDEIDAYAESGESMGAAGAYRLQRNGWKLVERIEGDWTTVVGLPLEKLIRIMEDQTVSSS